MRIIYFILFPFLLINNLAAQTKQTPIIPITISTQDNSLCDPHDEKVCTPFGLALKSKIHYVDKNHHLKIIKGQVQLINKRSGNIDEVYGEKNTSKSAVEMSEYKDGWNTYAVYIASQIENPATFFSAKWIVPSPPKMNDQLLYLFTALMGWDVMDNGNYFNHILQPVLQWGLSPAGGGNYWAINNWYVNDQGFFYDSLIVVNSGDILQGVLKETSVVNNRFSYSSCFYGYPTQLQIDSLPQLQQAYLALESYKAERSDEYPTDEKIKFSDIHLETDIKNPQISWNLYKSPNNLGQYTKVVNPSSDGGEIDIYFRKPYSKNDFDEIHFYPNPVNDFLHISPNYIVDPLHIFPDKEITNCKIELFNSFGRLIQTYFYEHLNYEFNLDMKNFIPGLYIIRFSYNNNTHAFKIIKS